MMELKENIPLAPLTTFQIGGPARYFADVKTADDIAEAIEWARERRMRFILLATGSNVLVPDGGLDALVIHVAEGAHSFEGEMLYADAGCNLIALIRAGAGRGLGGWEKLAGIPGTIGGAVRGNAGAFGTEIKDVAASVHAFNSRTRERREFSSGECDFSYRHSFFKDNPEWIITRAAVHLRPVPSASSNSLIEETIAEREKRHLQNVRAAGSFFMNPVAPKEIQEMFEREKGEPARFGRVPAGWLIEKAGLKGARVGGAVASEQHPNYIVNVGNATARNVLELAAKIKYEVRKQFGVELQEEAAILS